MPDIFELINKYTDYNNGSISTSGIIIYILEVIAMWRIFTKAHESGWKSLIPIYNVYVLCRIVKYKFWIIVISFIILFIPIVGTLIGIFMLLYSFIAINIRLSKRFNHGLLFGIGLLLFHTLFILILGLGPAKYKG